MNVAVRAVASNWTGGYAIFASQALDCDNHSLHSKIIETIHWSGSNAITVGRVHSNSGVKVSDSDNQIQGALTYRCETHISGQDNTFSSGPTQVGVRPPPVSLTLAAFTNNWAACTFRVDGTFDLPGPGAWWEGGNESSKRLKPGLYCSDGMIKLSGSDVVAPGVTFAATGKVHISGSNFDLTAYRNPAATRPFPSLPVFENPEEILIFSSDSGPGAADAAKPSGSTWRGLLYAPFGQVDISGSANFTVAGRIIASTVKLSGSNWGISYTGRGRGKPHLLE